VVVASAGPDANHLHLAADSTSPLSFIQAGCPSCHPTNSIEQTVPGKDDCRIRGKIVKTVI